MKTFWDRCAEHDLRNYGLKAPNMEAVREEVRELEEKMIAPKSAAFGKIPVQGGGSNYEERLISDIYYAGKLRDNLEEFDRESQRIEKALSLLPDEDVRVLRYLCIEGKRPADFAAEYSYSVQWVYALKDRALRDFCIARYGCNE